MKKHYQKPMAYFEDMRFDSAIAASQCSAIIVENCQPIGATGDACTPYNFADCAPNIYFTSDPEVCSDGEFTCYHTSAGVQGLS